MIRDIEIDRLIQYSKCLGVSVRFEKYKRLSPMAEWNILSDNSREIVIYKWPGISKTTIILNLLHELAHEKSFILQHRELDIKVLNAASLPDSKLTKKQRAIIYQMEKHDSKYRLEIAHELDIRIPKWKIEKDITSDLKIYKRFINGKN